MIVEDNWIYNLSMISYLQKMLILELGTCSNFDKWVNFVEVLCKSAYEIAKQYFWILKLSYWLGDWIRNQVNRDFENTQSSQIDRNYLHLGSIKYFFLFQRAISCLLLSSGVGYCSKKWTEIQTLKIFPSTAYLCVIYLHHNENVHVWYSL